jgi:hypothetical protein
MSGVHSIFAPSSAERQAACAASVTLERAYPETGERTEALEGEGAHWVTEQTLASDGKAQPSVGARAPNGVFVTDEMIEGADIMFEDISALLEPFGLMPSDGMIEVSVSVPRVHELCYGTPDYRIWLPTPRPTLVVYDYKFGHRVVDAFENWQLMDYVSGAISATALHDLDVDVIVKVVQPRSFHRDGPVREWRFAAADIRQFQNIRHMQALKALAPNPPAQTGPHCGDCRARHACTALQKAAYAAIDYSEKALPLELTPAAMGLELVLVTEAIKRLEARKSGLEEQTKGTMHRGQDVPHWAFEQGTGRERWTVPDAQVIALAKVFNVNVAQPQKALTPKQAEKAGLPLHALAGLVETPKTALALVRDDGSKLRKVFGK